MLARIRTLSRDEDGQALILAALLLFAIALGVIGTANLGQTIHARIELQNAADNAAYSLAAHEARAFNFYAYTNRAQISQYVTIAQLLSVDAILLGVLNSLGSVAAIMKTVEELCDDWKRELCLAIPVVGQALVAVSEAAGLIESTARAAGAVFTAFDLFVGQVAVPLLVGANVFLFANQATFYALVTSRLADAEALRIARATSHGAELWTGGFFQSAANIARFTGAHFPEAAQLGGTTGSPHSGLADGREGRKNYARRGMSELIHATRYSPLVYDRAFPKDLLGALGKVTGLDTLDTLTEFIPGFGLRGHTRLHSEPNPVSTPSAMKAYYSQMEESGQYISRYPTGSSIGANFYPHSSIGGGISDALGMSQKHLGSVTSTGKESGDGWACAWDLSDPYESFHASLVTVIYSPNFSCTVNKGKHPWWGITPYMAFNADAGRCEDPAQEHCQPDVWVALRLPSKAVGLSETQAIDREIATPGGAASARNVGQGDDAARAIARGIAYYHRPGNWQEQPNFFNPYWRAKLAPIQPGLERTADDAGVLGLLELVPDSIESMVLTH